MGLVQVETGLTPGLPVKLALMRPLPYQEDTMYQAPATPLSPLPAIPRDPKAIRAAMAMLEILAVWIETDHNDAPAEAREQTRIAANDRADDALNELERAGKGEIAKALYSWHAENV